MKKILLIILLTVLCNFTKAQSVFSFKCSRDSAIPCATVCMTVKAKIPDLKRFVAGSNYSINPISGSSPGQCYVEPVSPSAPGNPVSLTIDDRYSNVINLGFPFPFFGTTYNSLVASTNGYVSFDVSLAGGFSHWSMTAGNVPTTSYDRALAMGVFHDLDPSETTSPTMSIKYDILGAAPHRKFIFTFYKVPLFGVSCASNIENTHQLVLYEGTGIIEVFVTSVQPCPSWNGGRKMIGLQNFARNIGVIPPGRGASDPAWGSVNMNEAWRFVPTGVGQSLLKRVELIDFSGTIIATGTTAPLPNGELDVDFLNVCPPAQTNNYIVRSVYEKFDDPAVEIIAHDTVNILRDPPPFTIATTVVNPLCNGQSTGSITFTSPLGPTYEYSIDAGATWQSSPFFPNLPAATYNVRAREGGNICAAFSTATITDPPSISATIITGQTNCSNKTGEITVNGSGGTAPYQYSIDGGITYQPLNIFSNLPIGTYSNIKVKDFNNCEYLVTPAPVITLLDTMRLELGPDSTICVGQTVQMFTQTNAETDTFRWTPTQPLLDFDTAKNPILKPVDTTTYRLTAKWGICPVQTDDITINVKHKPIPDAGKDTSICYKTFAYLNANATNLSGTVNYAWAPASMVTPNNVANAIAWPDTSRYFYVTVTDNYGCNFSVVDSVKVTMRDPIPAFAGNDTIAMLNKPHQMEATGGVKFLWTPASPLNNPFIRMPLATLSHDQYFEVEVSDEIGCKATDGIFVKVYEGPTYHLPNAFSPNGDGLNEVFRPIPSGIQSTEYFRVFDRYGTLMFQTQEWMKGWNGNYQGKPALAGTYAWTIKGIDVNGAPIEMKGTVILIR
ncbi:MAG: gliding motility-associated C-terminal domain-containing protein [Ferruginibacter sp.]|nr:gliding motility-associated C-terminal domain-containing protein [Ferruginibacter sp.]